MGKNKTRVGIVGCGTIGSSLAEFCVDKLKSDVELKAIFDLDTERAETLKDKLQGRVRVVKSLDKLIASSDLVVEAASVEAIAEVLKKAIRAGKDVMAMSVGGIIGREDLMALARKNNCKLYIPSGAVLGLDGIKAAALRRIDEVILTTTKPPEGLKGAPYIEKNRIDLDSMKAEALIFEGSASEAIKEFPKNINVSATLSLAGIGAKKTRVRIVCSPGSNRNIHEVELKGESGNFSIKAENLPSPNNPKTSYLAALSAMAVLKGIVDSVRIGT